MRSVLVAEVTAFSDASDDGSTLCNEIKEILKRHVPIILLTDSKSLFEIILKGSRTSENGMMLDIVAARQRYKRHEISNIGFVRCS